MKMLLKKIPTEGDLSRLYWELAIIGAPSVGEKRDWIYQYKSKEELIALACEMLRYDPRLLTILVIYFLTRWEDINPVKLRQFGKNMKCPQTLGVLKEFIVTYLKDKELKYFFEYLIKDIKPVPIQLFFIHLYSVGSKKNTMIVKKSLQEYSKWGFLGIERPMVDLGRKETIGSYSFQTRQKMLKDLLKMKKRVTLSIYLQKLNFSISRQQALYDLKQCEALRLVGHGRGATWVKK